MLHTLSNLRPSRCVHSFYKLVSRRSSSSSQKMTGHEWEDQARIFLQELKATDPKELVKSMGGHRKPPEENLFASYDEGFGYITSVAVGRSVEGFKFVRKTAYRLTSDTSKKPREFYTLKLLTSQASVNNATGRAIEFDVYRKIGTVNPSSPGFNHCLHLEQSFTIFSPNGVHSCFVTEALSSSLARLREPGKNRFSLPIVKRITKQVLHALDYLHRECGYIHTGIKESDNILASIPEPKHSRIENYVLSHSYRVYGPPLKLKSEEMPIIFTCSQPLPYFDLGGSLEEISVRLMDFSHATPVDNPDRSYYCQPGILRAPEVTLQYPWTSTIDIWTVGCLVFELLTERYLFNQDDTGDNDYSHELHLQHIEECLGPFPLEFLKDCKDWGKYFDEKGMLLHKDSNCEPTPIEDVLRALEVMDEDKIPNTANFIRKCLTLDPKLRPSAQELLRDDWLS
ncbi:hypothetical protein NP233_g5080 [Leucocoprinus birnbaumii]|uniref:non-specific serine/threonine protein kinase n=1 Tax=Leucocoprinus birnbaumii TaxID=56174 RepID=A0AAD5YUX7_9AGAR|nr:hypothetical protein NP233_g5080 [Leucocoprinus birnbaumii]